MTAPALTYRHVLRDRRLAGLLAGDAVSKAGDGMVVVALPLQVLRHHAGVPAALAIAAVETAPFVLSIPVGLLAGLGRRRHDTGRMLLADCTLRAATYALLGALALVGQLGFGVLLLAMLFGSTLRVLGVAGRRLLATERAGSSGRFATNGLLGFNDNVAGSALGPALGGLLVVTAGPGAVLVVDGLTYLPLVAAVVVARRGVAAQPEAAAEGPARSGWATLRAVPVARRLLAVTFWFFVFYGPVEVALPLLVRGPLHAGGGALGTLWTAFGVGTVAGALLTGSLRRLPGPPLLVAIVALWGLAIAGVGLAPTVVVAAVVFAAGGLVWAPYVAVGYSVLQDRLAPAEQQPVLILSSATVAVTAPLGFLFGGPVVQALGSRGGLLVSGALTVALVPFAMVALRGRAPVGRVSAAGR